MRVLVLILLFAIVFAAWEDNRSLFGRKKVARWQRGETFQSSHSCSLVDGKWSCKTDKKKCKMVDGEWDCYKKHDEKSGKITLKKRKQSKHDDEYEDEENDVRE
jgi:hypothetical protein